MAFNTKQSSAKQLCVIIMCHAAPKIT